MCSVIDGSKSVLMTQPNFCNDKARCPIAISKKGGFVFNKYFLANACFLVMIVSVIAAFMDKITWGDVGLIFVGTVGSFDHKRNYSWSPHSKS